MRRGSVLVLVTLPACALVLGYGDAPRAVGDAGATGDERGGGGTDAPGSPGSPGTPGASDAGDGAVVDGGADAGLAAGDAAGLDAALDAAGLDAAPFDAASCPSHGHILLRTRSQASEDESRTLLMEARCGGPVVDVTEQLRLANAAPLANPGREMSFPHLSPDGVWLTWTSERWERSPTGRYVTSVGTWTKLPVTAVTQPDYETEAQIVASGALRLVWESKSNWPDGAAGKVSRIYTATRATAAATTWSSPTPLTEADEPYPSHEISALKPGAEDVVLTACTAHPVSNDSEGEAICRVSLTGTRGVVVVAATALPGGDYSRVSRPSYAPDGTIVFAGFFGVSPSDGRHLLRLSPDGGVATVTPRSDRIWHACVLPDGTIAAVKDEQVIRFYDPAGALLFERRDLVATQESISTPRGIVCAP